MTLLFLHDHPELTERVADIMFEAFGTPPHRAVYDGIVSHSLTAGKLPMAIVAMEDGIPVGTVGIWRADLLSRQDLCPWLGCLTVLPAYRGRGIAGELLQAGLRCCRELGFECAYLFTTLEGFYEKKGWQFYETGFELDGSPQRIYRCKFVD